MNLNIYEQIRSSRTVQVFVALTGTLILGALGSGLWELLLRDVIVGLGNFILSLISSMWGGYVDLLHRDIGKLRSDLLITPVFVVTMVALLFGPWVFTLWLLRRVSRLKKRLSATDDHEPLTPERLIEQVNSVRKLILGVLVPLTVVSTVLYSILGWQLAYTRNAGIWAERSIEILLPYVPDQEHNKLRSDLRAVEKADQFYALESRLQELATNASIKLPSFTVIRKRSAT